MKGIDFFNFKFGDPIIIIAGRLLKYLPTYSKLTTYLVIVFAAGKKVYVNIRTKATDWD
jgi:hypothetical protein